MASAYRAAEELGDRVRELEAQRDEALRIARRAECILVSGACNVPGYRTSVSMRFYDDDWRDLLARLSGEER